MRSNFVLCIFDDNYYAVMQRIFTKAEYSKWDHFIGFFETTDAAYAEALKRLEKRKATLDDKINELKKRKKKGAIYA